MGRGSRDEEVPERRGVALRAGFGRRMQTKRLGAVHEADKDKGAGVRGEVARRAADISACRAAFARANSAADVRCVAAIEPGVGLLLRPCKQHQVVVV